MTSIKTAADARGADLNTITRLRRDNVHAAFELRARGIEANLAVLTEWIAVEREKAESTRWDTVGSMGHVADVLEELVSNDGSRWMQQRIAKATGRELQEDLTLTRPAFTDHEQAMRDEAAGRGRAGWLAS